MDRPSLAQFFRTSDHSTEIVGGRQAGTFQHLAALSGHGQLKTAPRQKTGKNKAAPVKAKAALPKATTKGTPPPATPPAGGPAKQRVGLTVRIEVNLPADGDQETYDNIFRSIRKNLIDGE